MVQIRGSSFNGIEWYEDGKGLNKINSFIDFENSAKFLIRNNYTSPNQLVIHGGSAGGLLIGSCLNMNPQLYNVAIMNVPFVDIITTMLDDTMPLTIVEYEEWGNPNIKSNYDYMLKYSPYDNIDPKKNYPNIYITTGLNDTAVHYSEPLKYFAKIRKSLVFQKNLKKIIIQIKNTGHSGSNDRYEELLDFAKQYSFILKHNCKFD